MQSFYQWLKKQVTRDDVVGDFAYTISHFEEPTSTRKKISGHMLWSNWLVDKKANADVIAAFNTAWKEYQEKTVNLA